MKISDSSLLGDGRRTISGLDRFHGRHNRTQLPWLLDKNFTLLHAYLLRIQLLISRIIAFETIFCSVHTGRPSLHILNILYLLGQIPKIWKQS